MNEPKRERERNSNVKNSELKNLKKSKTKECVCEKSLEISMAYFTKTMTLTNIIAILNSGCLFVPKLLVLSSVMPIVDKTANLFLIERLEIWET